MELFLLFVVIITFIAALPAVLSKPINALAETDLQIISSGTQLEIPFTPTAYWEEIEEESIPQLLLGDFLVSQEQAFS
ncbi:MAG: hypothetical protein AB8G15_08935 [Saprospiraceae bacterium]